MKIKIFETEIFEMFQFQYIYFQKITNILFIQNCTMKRRPPLRLKAAGMVATSINNLQI